MAHILFACMPLFGTIMVVHIGDSIYGSISTPGMPFADVSPWHAGIPWRCINKMDVPVVDTHP